MIARHVIPAFMLSATVLTGPAAGQGCDTHSGVPVPRFVTLKFDEVVGRAGPSFNHPVRWEYVREGLPVEIIAETADWRRVRDPGGELTWMHRRTLSGRRAARAIEETPLHARPDGDSPVEGVAQSGANLWLERCRSGWCRLEAGGVRGWARAAALWGVYEWEAEGGGALEPSSRPCYRSADAAETSVARADSD